jgi:hypothetical protein
LILSLIKLDVLVHKRKESNTYEGVRILVENLLEHGGELVMAAGENDAVFHGCGILLSLRSWCIGWRRFSCASQMRPCGGDGAGRGSRECYYQFWYPTMGFCYSILDFMKIVL